MAAAECERETKIKIPRIPGIPKKGIPLYVPVLVLVLVVWKYITANSATG
jgi:hypothetical protein